MIDRCPKATDEPLIRHKCIAFSEELMNDDIVMAYSDAMECMII